MLPRRTEVCLACDSHKLASAPLNMAGRGMRSSGNTISYTPLGRAYNRHNPALGQTMNAAMLAVIYGNAIAPPNATDVEVVRPSLHQTL